MKIPLFVFLGIFGGGLLVGHFVWGASRVDVQKEVVQVDVVKNTPACKAKGGTIIGQPMTYVDNQYIGEGYYSDFTCFIPSKTEPLSTHNNN